jgi:hypothetical protein
MMANDIDILGGRSRLTIDDVVRLPENRDDRSIQQKARDDHRASLRSEYENTLAHIERLKRTPSAAAQGPAMRHAERRLADIKARLAVAGMAVE